VPEEEPKPGERKEDGLDLARDVTRATAGSASPASRKRRRRGRPRRDDRGTEDPRRGWLSGTHPDDRDPQPLGGELAKLVDTEGWELMLRVRGVIARWEELVGDEIAAHATPETFIDGVLVVRTDSTAWATQLKLLTPQVLSRLNEELGAGTVTVLEVRGPDAPSWSRGRRSVRGRGPRDTYG
jgi:predicted nucleic acid-binding Zn ribbon protein